MRLSKIKLAGFKSFVDPTTINFSSNLTGIIGPNGCGKSNTIDAVRWVMGESSAKYLRGHSMEDVIFKGSTARAPVGVAYVELVFDNSDGQLTGQYANYSEISIRREVSRDGKSNYFLNKSRCRRRDITDIFLGTGLGPRSYAIIEQGMISRLIEAKPEEMRVYLEEAAGISKYKERRRETQNRIGYSRDNLARLDDLRDEISKQLNRLQQQAKVANKYKELKQEQRLQQASLQAIKWRDLKKIVNAKTRELEAAENQLQAKIAKQRELEAALEKQRSNKVSADEKLAAATANWYQIGADISTGEQSIAHIKKTAQQQQSDLKQLLHNYQQAKNSAIADKDLLQKLKLQIAEQTPQYEQLCQENKKCSQQEEQQENSMQNWQQNWNQFQQKYANWQQQKQVEGARSSELDKALQDLKQRLANKRQQQQQQQQNQYQAKLTAATQQFETAKQQQQAADEDLKKSQNELQLQRKTIGQLEQKLQQLQNTVSGLKGRQQSLLALQEAALADNDLVLGKWLQKNNLKQNKRLAQQIKVEPKWHSAVEWVLAEKLNALSVANLEAYQQAIEELQNLAHGRVTLLQKASSTAPDAASLLAKTSCEYDLTPWLAKIKTANSLHQAVQMRSQLAVDESVITADGVWLGKNWLSFYKPEQAEHGILHLEQQLVTNKQQLVLEQTALEKQQQQLAAQKSQFNQLEQQNQNLQHSWQQAQTELATASANLQTSTAQNQRWHSDLEQMAAKCEDLEQKINSVTDNLEQSQQKWQLATDNLSQLETEKNKFATQRQNLSHNLQQSRLLSQKTREKMQSLQLSLHSMRTKKQALQQNLERVEQQLQQLDSQRKNHEQQIHNTQQPLADLQRQLELSLSKRISAEERISTARDRAQKIEQEYKNLEQQRMEIEKLAREQNANLHNERLKATENKVRCQTIKEDLSRQGFKVKKVLAKIADDTSHSTKVAHLEQLNQKIKRLGAINLAAIDEFNEQTKRKQYLDAQHQDLSDALATLEAAIKKIDRETKSRFKDTFEQVNKRIGEMFPKLFGGGQAYLELTSDDLLETGVSIMARPPGKRVSNINLLSGGEKALTALAMVFAIFELNPAPFCMLDEVDAPLDEANVGRFCNLLQEMSKQVQFIFITHNKPTMELAQQLHGVTMREAGVSRIVAVNVDEASQLVEA